jgi:protein transport protein SEC23
MNNFRHDKACTYYSGLADRLIASGHIFDFFACSLDQIGLAEMKVTSLSSTFRRLIALGYG